MLFQDELANKLQHVLCGRRDFYLGPSGKQLLDWPRWEERRIARDQMLVALAGEPV